MDTTELVQYLDTHSRGAVKSSGGIDRYAISSRIIVRISAVQVSVGLAVCQASVALDLETNVETSPWCWLPEGMRDRWLYESRWGNQSCWQPRSFLPS